MMANRPGFSVMDVDVAIADDPKFKLIARSRPDHLGPAFMAYLALLGESWKSAERATIVDAWPSLLSFDQAVVDTMTGVRLLDKSGRVPATAWRKRFTEANQRRIRARQRYNRYNQKRARSSTNDDAVETSLPRGNHVATTATEPFRSEPIRTVPNRSESENGVGGGRPSESRGRARGGGLTRLADSLPTALRADTTTTTRTGQ